ncbi:TusA-related sulfurtransferase [Caminicella sporogenes DSM 14501]|uniref:TusA-related sulfurtransferase n=1 Tax=Caminicella sporogenes DSM 14501 TaxID=1121266 RepID=A0A1M6NXA2_9FIRM|nr:sulfurtransferase TusA family protein [Caminicella sporogenes]RKD21611.1 SirA family protein [Caminicella sporogenes]WIF94105.1 sulfurtransferase TusA family protein [Caminicella sporogenes]SHK00306.1 TusA-related sulfurtransferase [Caminicella sporogenes DSM 14501]
MDRVDARGMSCPQPVLMTKNAIKNNPNYVEIIVDNNTAKENVSRFLKNNGYKVEISEVNEDYLLKGIK